MFFYVIVKWSYPLAGIASLLTFTIGYIVLYLIIEQRWLYILMEDCNPERYLEHIRKQKEHTKRSKRTQVLLSVNESAAYILMGEPEQAISILDELDEKSLTERNGNLLVYMINYISCCFGLGRTQEAIQLFEERIPVLSPVTKQQRISVKILMGERYFYLKKYDESYELLKALMDIEMKRCSFLSILYTLAQIDEIRGDNDLARKKYQKIALYGNKLAIASYARNYLEQKKEPDIEAEEKIGNEAL